MSENGGEGVTLSWGSGSIFWPQGPMRCLWQMTHFLMMRLTSRLPSKFSASRLRARFLDRHVTSVCGHLVLSLQLLYAHVTRLFDVLFLQKCHRTVIVHLLLSRDQFCHNKGLLQLSTARSLLYMHPVESTYSISTLPVASFQLKNLHLALNYFTAFNRWSYSAQLHPCAIARQIDDWFYCYRCANTGRSSFLLTGFQWSIFTSLLGGLIFKR